jgi:beta-lactamase class A
MVVTGVPPWDQAKTGNSGNNAANDTMTKLGDAIYSLLAQGGFEPFTERQASVFVMNLVTQQAISLNPGVAYSGVSMMKIPVMLSYYRKFATTPDKDRAKTIANMMVCSENSASNSNLKAMGDGDELQGAKYVTDTMNMLGLKDTFLARPFFLGKADPNATPTPVAELPIKTTADQVSTEPDLYNQSTPADLGWLLSSIYECAANGDGPIATVFGGDVTMMECRHIVNTMRADKIGALIEAGVPAGISVAHKHGWANDTHGDAGLLVTPGGDYVLVAMLHNQTWLKSDDSFPLVAEISRITYNTFNPTAPLDKIHPQPVPADCTFSDQLITDIQSPDLPPIR